METTIGYEVGANHDADWGGFCRNLDEASKPCQRPLAKPPTPAPASVYRRPS